LASDMLSPVRNVHGNLRPGVILHEARSIGKSPDLAAKDRLRR
jgi:hypothetical protein